MTDLMSEGLYSLLPGSSKFGACFKYSLLSGFPASSTILPALLVMCPYPYVHLLQRFTFSAFFYAKVGNMLSGEELRVGTVMLNECPF